MRVKKWHNVERMLQTLHGDFGRRILIVGGAGGHVRRVFARRALPPAQKVCPHQFDAKDCDHYVQNVHEDEDGHRDERKVRVSHKLPHVVGQTPVEEKSQAAIAEHVQPSEIAVQPRIGRVSTRHLQNHSNVKCDVGNLDAEPCDDSTYQNSVVRQIGQISKYNCVMDQNIVSLDDSNFFDQVDRVVQKVAEAARSHSDHTFVILVAIPE